MTDLFAPYAEFHFLRPLWLLVIIPALFLVTALWRQRSQLSLWNCAIDSALLPHLLDSKLGKQQIWPLVFLLLIWIVSSISLSGPVWEKLPQPVQKKEDALIIIQDLSLSFYAQDLSPNRLTRAQHKLFDILQKRKEGTTALVVYSGDAHTVAPLTDDTRTIASMVPSLSPGIMPSYGSNLADAVDIALGLFKETAINRRNILLLTDEVSEEDIIVVTELLAGRNMTLSVIGVGTESGGPIPQNDGGFWKDDNGTIIIPRMDRSLMQELAAKNHGRYSDIQLTDEDIEYLLAVEPILSAEDDFRRIEREFDQWQEQGVWLLLLILPVVLLTFRKGWILGFVLIMTYPGHCYALSWDDLWQRKDQQAQKIMEEDPGRAAELFRSQPWKGSASYKAGQFEAAAQAFGKGEHADTLYNQGNSLAKLGKLEKAINAYENALRLDPDMEDAVYNKELLEKLMQQQQEQNQESEGDKSDEQAQEGEQPQGEQKSDQGKRSEQQEDEQNSTQSQSGEDQDKDNAEQQQSQKAEDKKGEEGEEKEAQQLNQEEKEGEEGDKKQLSKMNQDDSEQLDGEQQQALEQWLRQVPDNPGGLLRRKFEYQSKRNQGRRTESDGKIW